MVIYSKKSSEKHEKQAIATTVVLMGRGYNPEMVCSILWYKLGVMATAQKNGAIALGAFKTFAVVG